ncbi:aminoacyl-histidine dipeptidase [Candidatus Dojkabacteria bacterium]|nr:aminoacyl-histidine dipeptidase [Candidatus Dojkabacteria bacterium]
MNSKQTTILEPKKVFEIFRQIAKIPHGSGNEKSLVDWIEVWADEHKLESERDSSGNIVLRVPASAGYENKRSVVLQGHLDMVCQKSKESNHDFEKDPISLVFENEWLRADNTTLGSDNGIGLAMCLAIAESSELPHPALELLFTVEEETGLVGASNLSKDFVKTKYLINLDSEDEGVVTIGCAGGTKFTVRVPISTKSDSLKNNASVQFYKLSIKDGVGGHSGVDIDKNRANAIMTLFRFLADLDDSSFVTLSSVSGGSIDNAIPRECDAIVGLNKDFNIKNAVVSFNSILEREYEDSDSNIRLYFESLNYKQNVLLIENSHKIIDFVNSLPIGVFSMSNDIKGLVETSVNLGKIETSTDFIEMIFLARGSMASKLDELLGKFRSLCKLSDVEYFEGVSYPGWEPNMKSVLLDKSKKVYKKNFNKDLKVEAVHGGLECGVIGGKYPSMDMISFGPTIKDAHSPDERIEIKSVQNVWSFLLSLLETL